MSFLGLGKALTWSSWQPFLQPLQARGQPGPLLHWALGSPWACQKLAGPGDGLGGCATTRGGSWLDERDPSMKGLQERDEQGVLFPPRMVVSRDGQTPHRWDNTCALACTATLSRGPLPLLPASGPGESKGGPCQSPWAASAPASPHTWGSWRGQRSEARPWSHSSPRARSRDLETRVPWQW